MPFQWRIFQSLYRSIRNIFCSASICIPAKHLHLQMPDNEVQTHAKPVCPPYRIRQTQEYLYHQPDKIPHHLQNLRSRIFHIYFHPLLPNLQISECSILLSEHLLSALFYCTQNVKQMTFYCFPYWLSFSYIQDKILSDIFPVSYYSFFYSLKL